MILQINEMCLLREYIKLLPVLQCEQSKLECRLEEIDRELREAFEEIDCQMENVKAIRYDKDPGTGGFHEDKNHLNVLIDKKDSIKQKAKIDKREIANTLEFNLLVIDTINYYLQGLDNDDYQFINDLYLREHEYEDKKQKMQHMIETYKIDNIGNIYRKGAIILERAIKANKA